MPKTRLIWEIFLTLPLEDRGMLTEPTSAVSLGICQLIDFFQQSCEGGTVVIIISGMRKWGRGL